MNAPSLFIGLVSHEGTAYPASQGPEGLAAELQRATPGALLQVNTENLSDGVTLGLDAGSRSVDAEMRVERAWNAYLGRSLRSSLMLAARSLRHRLGGARARNSAAVRRLLDIEFSHRNLMQAGMESGAPWVLIVEDDGSCADIHDLAAGVRGLMDSGLAYVNLSRSFSVDALRVGHLLTPTDVSWKGSAPRGVFAARQPVTNTVCAILYSRTFLEQLLPLWDAMPLEPVVPIDWKLNAILMRMYQAGSFPRGGCAFVEPAPITQGSLVRTAQAAS